MNSRRMPPGTTSARTKASAPLVASRWCGGMFRCPTTRAKTCGGKGSGMLRRYWRGGLVACLIQGGKEDNAK